MSDFTSESVTAKFDSVVAKYKNQPHAVFVIVKTGAQELTIPVGTFPNVDAALSASAEAMTESEKLVAASPMAGSATATTMISPAPADWKGRLEDVLTILKEEQDEHDEWVARVRAGAL